MMDETLQPDHAPLDAAGRAAILAAARAQLVQVAPAFGTWLDAQGIPAEQRVNGLCEPWAAQFYAAALLTGTADTLTAFLVVLDDAARTLRHSYGWRFADQLMHALFAAQRRDIVPGDDWPPILRLTLDEWYADDYFQSRHDTWSYGISPPLPPPPSGY